MSWPEQSAATNLPLESPLVQFLIQQELDRREEERARALKIESSTSNQENQRRVREATKSTAHWLRNYTKTFNPHWVEEKRPAPNEPFPDWYFFDAMLEMIEIEEISAIEKSRDMMVSWAVVGYFTLQAQMVPHREIVFQTLDDSKVQQLIEYAKCLWDQQPSFLKEAFPLSKPLLRQGNNEIAWANGSVIYGVAGGKGKIRSYHPWGFFSDESSFQPEAVACLDEALGTGAKKIVMASTANVGAFADYRGDVTL
jgi:hypothetical protein